MRWAGRADIKLTGAVKKEEGQPGEEEKKKEQGKEEERKEEMHKEERRDGERALVIAERKTYHEVKTPMTQKCDENV